MDHFSKLGTIKLNDWSRGLIVAIATTPLTIIYQSVSAGTLVFDWKAIIIAAITGGVGYLIKNLATGINGQLLTNNPSKPEVKP